MDWFLDDKDFRHEKVNALTLQVYRFATFNMNFFKIQNPLCYLNEIVLWMEQIIQDQTKLKLLKKIEVIWFI